MTTATNTVWLSPNATSFSCLCERCLDSAGARGTSFFDAVATATVCGPVAAADESTVARCRAGHEIRVRRSVRRPRLPRSNATLLRVR